MAKIYISSTYGDLKDYREKVYHALLQWGHQVIAMEDYVASDQRPLDKCLADVAGCSPPVGRAGLAGPAQIPGCGVGAGSPHPFRRGRTPTGPPHRLVKGCALWTTNPTQST